MEVSTIVLRASTEQDMAAVQAIYAEHVRTGSASFELSPPSVNEISERRAAVLGRGHPYWIAVDGPTVVGFAYASTYRPRPAYRWTLEDSVYVAPRHTRRGIGGRLLDALIEQATALGYRQMVAVIGGSAHRPSIVLHERAGFRTVGVLRAVGFKHGRWVDTVLLQRPLGPADKTLPEPVREP